MGESQSKQENYVYLSASDSYEIIGDLISCDEMVWNIEKILDSNDIPKLKDQLNKSIAFIKGQEINGSSNKVKKLKDDIHNFLTNIELTN